LWNCIQFPRIAEGADAAVSSSMVMAGVSGLFRVLLRVLVRNGNALGVEDDDR